MRGRVVFLYSEWTVDTIGHIDVFASVDGMFQHLCKLLLNIGFMIVHQKWCETKAAVMTNNL